MPLKTSKCKTCKKNFSFYTTKTRGVFCSKKCQYSYDYPGCYWVGNNGYIYHQVGRHTKELLHRKIAGALTGQVVHHKDGNKLNNIKSNLEILKNQSIHIKKHNPVMFRWSK